MIVSELQHSIFSTVSITELFNVKVIVLVIIIDCFD